MNKEKILKTLSVIKKKLTKYKLELENCQEPDDDLLKRALDGLIKVEEIGKACLLQEDSDPCEEVRKKYLLPLNRGAQLYILDSRALLQPSKEGRKDPFFARTELLKRIDCINQHDKLEKRKIVLSFSNGRFSITSPNDRYRLRNNIIEDRFGDLPASLNNGLVLPDGSYRSREQLQILLGNLRSKTDSYLSKKRDLDAEMELLRANISSLLITEKDLVLIQEMSELYLDKKKQKIGGCIWDLINRLHRIRDLHYKAYQNETVYRALTFTGNPYRQMEQDWAADGDYLNLEKDIIEALEKTKKRELAKGEPEILEEHKDEEEKKEYNVEDLSLPYSVQGANDDQAISLNDIDQGALGDCYFLSSIGAIAKDYPELFSLGKMVKEKGDKYVVTLYLRKDKNSTERTATEIEISKKALLNKDGTPIYAGKADGELWVIALERALAQEMGGFDNIEGGRPENAMEMLTGKTAHKMVLEEIPGSASEKRAYLLENLKTAQDEKYPVTFSSKGKDEAEKEIIDASGNMVTLFGGHAYTFEKLEGNTVTLYNPHGKNHLTLGMTAILSEFNSVSVLNLQK